MAILARLGQALKTDLTDFKSRKLNEAQSEKNLLDFMKQRRTVRSLGSKVSHKREELIELIKEAVYCCPSALNSQSVRVVILTHNAHVQFWNMVKEQQKTCVPEHILESALLKIDRCAYAYGTVLFFEDQDVLKTLQKQKPLQADEFDRWSEQTSGMAQFAVWTALSSIGLGAALQHYNPIIDAATLTMFDLPNHWELKAQLVFGSIQKSAKEKSVLEDEVLFRSFS